jgi:hypothetical protein
MINFNGFIKTMFGRWINISKINQFYIEEETLYNCFIMCQVNEKHFAVARYKNTEIAQNRLDYFFSNLKSDELDDLIESKDELAQME